MDCEELDDEKNKQIDKAGLRAGELRPLSNDLLDGIEEIALCGHLSAGTNGKHTGLR